MSLVEFRNVSFSYANSKQNTLNNISFSLDYGQIVGLLGPNGSGKTTIMKTIVGLLKIFKGEIFIDGQQIGPETKNIVSYLPDFTYLDEKQKISTVMNFFADIYSDFDRNKMEQILQSMDISTNSFIKTLSKGNKEKLQLALVLSRNAKVYVLDEPIGGVDPVQRDFILHTIISNYAQNSLVIISTHLIEDVESILNHALFIKNGNIVINDTVESIKKQFDKTTLNDVFKEVFKC